VVKALGIGLALKKAMDRGITVILWDAAVATGEGAQVSMGRMGPQCWIRMARLRCPTPFTYDKSIC
jgi:hypothetical protein